MSLSRADQLRQRAREIEDHSWAVRWTSPDQSRALLAISRELTEMALHLPPEPRSES